LFYVFEFKALFFHFFLTRVCDRNSHHFQAITIINHDHDHHHHRQLSAVPKSLPCREEERKEVYGLLESAIKGEGKGAAPVIYIR
jgi:hypothetical protein